MSWRHLRDEHPKAATDHRCWLCGGEIGQFETHVKRTGITTDGLYSFRVHALCESLTRDWEDESSWTCDPATFREEVLAPALASRLETGRDGRAGLLSPQGRGPDPAPGTTEGGGS